MADKEFTGSALYAQWIAYNSGGTALGTVVLNTDFRNFNYTPSVDLVDATAGADACKKNLVSFKGGGVTCSQVMQSDLGTATMAILAEGVSGTMTWAEAGTASGSPKHEAGFLCLGTNYTTPYNDVVILDTSWSQNSARTDSAY
jgi:hypothetical protein